LDSVARDGDEDLTCQRWLRETPAKRFIFHKLYGDLLSGSGRKILDVGGGLTSMTRLLASKHDYTLVDLMAHDPSSRVQGMLGTPQPLKIVMRDWYEVSLEDGYDIVVANDLFPNVDQRLDLFLSLSLPRAGEVRLALTYYNEPRFYRTKRVGADETLFMLAWDGETTRRCLIKHEQYIDKPNLGLLSTTVPSPFSNKRQVCLATLRGGWPIQDESHAS
jgi:hypothetical protein